MDLYYKQELKVGVIVIVAVTIFVIGLLWLSGRTIGAGATVTVPVRFTNVSGLTPGDPVQISGVKVGRVANVVLEDVGSVMVYLEVSRRNRPHTDAKAIVASLDFFGEKYVDYIPGNAPDLLRDGQIITGQREVAITETATDLTGRAADALTGVQTLLSERTAEDIHRTLVAVERTLNVVARLGEGPTVGELRQTLASVQQLAKRMDSTLARPDIERSLEQVDDIAGSMKEMSERLNKATTSLGSILEKMDQGQGVLGRALNDSTLHGDLHETLVALRKLLDDVRERPARYVNIKVF
jgi:phospholipid/cholesterol/gamma-HCH transport system substrate-binding protein